MPSPIMLQHPLSSGAVTDWDDMEELWKFGIEEEMRLDAVEHPVLMADSTATGSSARYGYENKFVTCFYLFFMFVF